MPIYGYGIISCPWTLVRQIDKQTFMKLQKIFRKACKEFFYSKDGIFLKSLTINIEQREPWIVKYDCSKTGIATATYQKELEELINYANKCLGSKYKQYKFDITGNWTTGAVIIMENKSKNKAIGK